MKDLLAHMLCIFMTDIFMVCLNQAFCTVDDVVEMFFRFGNSQEFLVHDGII